MKAPRRNVVAAVVVSDATSLEALGLNGRQFRAFVRAYGVPHAKVGRRTVARVDLVLEAIDRLSGVAVSPSIATPWDEAKVVELAARRRSS